MRVSCLLGLLLGFLLALLNVRRFRVALLWLERFVQVSLGKRRVLQTEWPLGLFDSTQWTCECFGAAGGNWAVETTLPHFLVRIALHLFD